MSISDAGLIHMAKQVQQLRERLADHELQVGEARIAELRAQLEEERDAAAECVAITSTAMGGIEWLVPALEDDIPLYIHPSPSSDARDAERLMRAITWAMGAGNNFPLRADGEGPYWWRKELCKRAGIVWDGTKYAPDSAAIATQLESK